MARAATPRSYPGSVAAYFSDDSMVRRVHRELVVAFAGPRALLLQATHPLAFSALFAHTSALDEPYERLNRTARVMDTIVWGSREDADRVTRRVRAMHRRVRGELTEPAGRFPAGTPYRADDPVFLLWVLASLVDSSLVVYDRYVARLGRDERDAYWQEYKQVGRLFALRDRDLPGTIEDFDAYLRGMLDGPDLHVGDYAREQAIDIVMRPPVPLAARGLLELVNQTTIGLLPPRVRRLYGFGWDPARGLAHGVGAEYTRRVLLPVLPSVLRHVPSSRAAVPGPPAAVAAVAAQAA